MGKILYLAIKNTHAYSDDDHINKTIYQFPQSFHTLQHISSQSEILKNTTRLQNEL